MTYTVYGDTYNSDGELGTKSIRSRINKNWIIRHIITQIVVLNNPPFTNLRFEIYTDKDDETMGELLHTSDNTPTKSEIITLANGVKWVTFDYSDIQIDGSNFYHYVLNGTASGLSGSSTIAWKHSFPDPVYRTGLALTLEELQVTPYDFIIIGDEL
jgi:hypothetical protein